MVRALEAVADRDLAGDQVDQRARDEERRDAARALLLDQEGRGLDGLEAADAGADQHAGAVAVLVGLGDPARVLDRLLGGGDAVEDEVVDLPLVLGLQVAVGVEGAVGAVAALDLAGVVRWRGGWRRTAWIVSAPDWPASRRRQVSSTPSARGVTSPRPVTTTRRIRLPPNAYRAVDTSGGRGAQPRGGCRGFASGAAPDRARLTPQREDRHGSGERRRRPPLRVAGDRAASPRRVGGAGARPVPA